MQMEKNPHSVLDALPKCDKTLCRTVTSLIQR
jgi:hypothetical protein